MGKREDDIRRLKDCYQRHAKRGFELLGDALVVDDLGYAEKAVEELYGCSRMLLVLCHAVTGDDENALLDGSVIEKQEELEQMVEDFWAGTLSDVIFAAWPVS